MVITHETPTSVTIVISKYLKIYEVAAILRVTPQMVYRECRLGILKHTRVGTQYRVDPHDLVEYLTARRNSVTAAKVTAGAVAPLNGAPVVSPFAEGDGDNSTPPWWAAYRDDAVASSPTDPDGRPAPQTLVAAGVE